MAEKTAGRSWRPVAGAVLAVEAVLIVAALVHGVRQPVYSSGDEGFHLDYVVRAGHGELPVVGRTRVDPRVLAVAQHRYPGPPWVAPERAGWAGQSYEGVQPPVYYVLAAPVAALSDDWPTKVRLLRWFAVALVLAGVGLLVGLCRELQPDGPGLAVALVLLPVCFAGFGDQVVRVSNDAAVLPFAVAGLWCAVRAVRSGGFGWLAAASALAVAATLTKVTAAVLFLLVAGSALAVLRRRGWLAALAAGGPVLALAPWLAWNWAQYRTWTATPVLMVLEAPVVNRYGVDYTAWSELRKVPRALAGLVLGQWPPGTPAGLLVAAGVLGGVLVGGSVLAAVACRRRVALTVVVLFVAVGAGLIRGAVVHDNPVFHSRLLVGWAPLLLLAPAVALYGAGPGRRAATWAGVLVLAVGGAVLGWAAR